MSQSERDRYVSEGEQAYHAGISWTETYERYAASDERRSLVAFGWLLAKQERKS